MSSLEDLIIDPSKDILDRSENALGTAPVFLLVLKSTSVNLL
jgi:hypothetical protein